MQESVGSRGGGGVRSVPSPLGFISSEFLAEVEGGGVDRVGD